MQKKRVFIVSIALLSAAGVLLLGLPSQSCQASRSSLAMSRGSTPSGIKAVVSANNRFAFNLYAKLGDSSQNVFFSPYSVSSALAMTYEGAGGKTASEMQRAMYLPKKNVLGPNMSAINSGLEKDAQNRSLWSGNALWVQKKFPLLKHYTTRIEKYYGGKATNLDFVSKPEQSRQTINAFIAKQTRNKITGLIPRGAIDENIRIVLTNAVYFKGEWKWQFEKDQTYEGDFKVSPSKVIKTEMMFMVPNEKEGLEYLDTGDLQILSLPYKGNRFSMLIVLPTGDLESLGRLTANKLDTYRAQMKPRVLDTISLPKFELHTEYALKEVLKKLGMPRLFSTRADLSGMDGKNDLSISGVYHKAYVKVDELGTEAAGGTAVTGGVTSVTPRNDFRADHPFIFLIQDNQTGNILFLGRVVDPTK